MRYVMYAVWGLLLGAIVGAGGCATLDHIDPKLRPDAELQANIPRGGYVCAGAVGWGWLGCFLGMLAAMTRWPPGSTHAKQKSGS